MHMHMLRCAFMCYEIQEAPLTLRGRRDRCRNIKEKPQIYGSFLTQGHAHFSSGCACSKFEVCSFTYCVNIEVGPHNFRELWIGYQRVTDGQTDGIAVAITALCIASNAAAR